MDNRKVFVGVSGGIDSAASLLMLKEQGYEVVGVYLLMLENEINNETKQQLEDLSKRAGVEIIVHNISDRFRRTIIAPFIESYLRGETPSPCVECNPKIKWQSLVEVADQRGGGWVATGHYCRVVEHNGLYYLAKGCDPLKDQSYYMWQLSQQILSRICFPLGEMTKESVRLFMQERGWNSLVEKRESMGVCFLEGKRFGDWLKDYVDVPKGEVVDGDGVVVGVHNGYPFYTLAQKRGFTLFKKGHNVAVVGIDCEKNRLIVGDSRVLTTRELLIRDCCFVSFEEVLNSDRLEVKVRGVGVNPSGYCRLEVMDEKRLKVVLCDDTAWAVTKGQPVVFYIQDRLVGGGISTVK